MMVSRQFIAAVKASDEPSHKLIARLEPRLQFHVSLLSKWINGAQRVHEGDERVIAIAQLLEIAPSDCFEPIGADIQQNATTAGGIIGGASGGIE